MDSSAAIAEPLDDPAAAARLRGWLDNYRPFADAPDELAPPGGVTPAPWLRFLRAVAAFPEGDFAGRFALATRHIRDAGVTHRIYSEDHERVWPLSPMPLILSEQEWAGIEAGVAQRATLLEAVLSDLYGEGRLVAQGHLPAAAVTGSDDFVRAMRGVKLPGGRPMHLYAADLGRGPDGNWWVLGDRTQSPSGAGYALENRMVLSRAFPNLYNGMNVQRLAPFFSDFRAGLTAAARRTDPRICLLTPGPFSESYFEQGASGPLSGLPAGGGRRSGGARRHRLRAHHRGSEAGRCDLAAGRRRLRRSHGAEQRLAPGRAGPFGSHARRGGGGLQHAGLGGDGVQRAVELPARPEPTHPRRAIEAPQRRHLVVRPADGARAGGGEHRDPGHRRGLSAARGTRPSPTARGCCPI